MALNLQDTLEILKRAGLGTDDKIKPSDTEQRLQERLQRLQVTRQPEQEQPNFSFRGSLAPSDPQSLPIQELLDIDDL